MPPEMVLVIHQLNAKTRVVSKVATVLQGKNNPPKLIGGGGGGEAESRYQLTFFEMGQHIVLK